MEQLIFWLLLLFSSADADAPVSPPTNNTVIVEDIYGFTEHQDANP